MNVVGWLYGFDFNWFGMKKRLLILWLFFLGKGLAFGQADIHFSQFYETSLIRNPALTGVFNDNYKITVYSRSQWNSIANPYQTTLLNAEYRISLGQNSNDFLSFGGLGYFDEAGDLDQKITGFYGAINYNKSLNPESNSYLSFGFAGGYLQYSFDPSKATVNNQFQNGVFNPLNPQMENWPTPKMNMADMGAGINYNFSPGGNNDATYMMGFSAYHFNQPEFSFYKTYGFTENIRGNGNAGMIKELTDHFLLQLHFNYAVQNTYQELIGGGLIGWRTFAQYEQPLFEIYAGVFYRYQDAIIPVVKIKYKHMSIGMSYDINVSSLTEASNMMGGYEITLTLTGNYPPNSGSGPALKTACPRF